MKTSAEIRSSFLDFFAKKNHQIIESQGLVPVNDPSLLFTNAGMVQFKDVFLGKEARDYKRAASSQKCLRAGGKHNDLDNVGYTSRHHTFFEMLGNFSFGDYFKKEAIHYAWEFLTISLELPKEKLWITVYKDDKEAADIWLKEIGINPSRFIRIGDKGDAHDSDNFWSMGNTGPCGPCSEIFYDHGEGVDGGPPGSKNEDGDRFVEIWNLVFMQYDRDEKGILTPLPSPSVDTGMGLERLAAVLQNVQSNYETDIFQLLIKATANYCNITDLQNKSLRVIADHIRSCSFLIIDGVLPGNEGREYVLRRIIRRAIRHGYQLGQGDLFFYLLVDDLISAMGKDYPQLIEKKDHIKNVLKSEEERFAETIDQGMQILEEDIKSLNGKIISGITAFRLYDTYGFPLDLTKDIAREYDLTVDSKGFQTEMDKQRQRGRSSSNFVSKQVTKIKIKGKTNFTGYSNTADSAKIIGLFKNGETQKRLIAGDEGLIVLNQTPFYAESGGQVGDQGNIFFKNTNFQVMDTVKQDQYIFGHIGKVIEGQLSLDDDINAEVNRERRLKIQLNHSATHLLHSSLRQLLGNHVQQKGSLVDDNRIRFDFSHHEPVSREMVIHIEALVNEHIRRNHDVTTQLMSYDDAQKSGALALFGEKYENQVRVLSMSDFSVELCGGTHVSATGDIGLFKIVQETGISSGIRRIEALTGAKALDFIENTENKLLHITSLVNSNSNEVENKIEKLIEQNKDLEKEISLLKNSLTTSLSSDLSLEAIEVGGIKVLAKAIENIAPNSLRNMIDDLKNKLKSGVILIISVNGQKVNLAAGITKDLTDNLKAGDLIRIAAEKVGGKGGGRSDLAQAGGSDPSGVNDALELVAPWVLEKIKN